MYLIFFMDLFKLNLIIVLLCVEKITKMQQK
jgi:hypothetical protein